MMTLIDYLLENSSLMSSDALKQASAKFDKLRLGKRDGSKPSDARSRQIEKRSNRKRGRDYEEDEEPIAPARRDRVQRIMSEPNETDEQQPSFDRDYQRKKRVVRSQYGIGGSRRNAKQIDEL